jgi:hypothetical protein
MAIFMSGRLLRPVTCRFIMESDQARVFATIYAAKSAARLSNVTWLDLAIHEPYGSRTDKTL